MGALARDAVLGWNRRWELCLLFFFSIFCPFTLIDIRTVEGSFTLPAHKQDESSWWLRVLKNPLHCFFLTEAVFSPCLRGHPCLQLFSTVIFQHHRDDNLDVYMLSALSVNRQMLLFWALVAVPWRRCISSVGSHNISVTHLVVPHFQAVFMFFFFSSLCFQWFCECLPSLMWRLTAQRHFDSHWHRLRSHLYEYISIHTS